MNNVSPYLTKPAYSVDEVVTLTGISRTAIFGDMKSGLLHRTKRGRRTLILADDLAHYLAALRAASASLPPPTVPGAP